MFEIVHPLPLQIAYAANILILVPVCLRLFRSGGPVARIEGRTGDYDILRLIVAALYLCILLGSVIGLFVPGAAVTILLMQVVYKSVWLGFYAVQVAPQAGWSPMARGFATVFAAIAIVFPFLIYTSIAGLP